MYEENAKAFLVHVDPRRSRDRTHFGAGAYLLVDRRLASLLARPGYLPSLSSYIVRYVPLFRFVTLSSPSHLLALKQFRGPICPVADHGSPSVQRASSPRP
jgi:hypothetical protein